MPAHGRPTSRPRRKAPSPKQARFFRGIESLGVAGQQQRKAAAAWPARLQQRPRPRAGAPKLKIAPGPDLPACPVIPQPSCRSSSRGFGAPPRRRSHRVCFGPAPSGRPPISPGPKEQAPPELVRARRPNAPAGRLVKLATSPVSGLGRSLDQPSQFALGPRRCRTSITVVATQHVPGPFAAGAEAPPIAARPCPSGFICPLQQGRRGSPRTRRFLNRSKLSLSARPLPPAPRTPRPGRRRTTNAWASGVELPHGIRSYAPRAPFSAARPRGNHEFRQSARRPLGQLGASAVTSSAPKLARAQRSRGIGRSPSCAARAVPNPGRGPWRRVPATLSHAESDAARRRPLRGEAGP